MASMRDSNTTAKGQGRGEGGSHHILAASCAADDRTRVLKHGDTFAVFDR